jgi:hypothetical protein
MRWMLVLAMVLASSNAFAGADHFTFYGAGTAFANNEAGLMLRIEKRVDITSYNDEEAPVWGARIGLEYWTAGGYNGIAMPVGFYAGAKVGDVRTTLGAGVGLWALELTGAEFSGGIAPYVSSTLELLHIEDRVIALEGRLSRQVLGDRDDFNVYSVMLSFGPHYDR